MNKIKEFFGESTQKISTARLKEKLQTQNCPFTQKRCFKIRKSEPDISIGTCLVNYGAESKNIIICPNRMLQKRQFFIDCMHLLSKHEPGNELHVVPEVDVPGGSVDYVLVSAKNDKLKDFIGIEFQTLDTTGTIWPEHQRLLDEHGVIGDRNAIDSKKSFGMNWKMTAKTILVQLHHKIETFEYLSKNLVLVVQNYLFDYMQQEFNFDHLSEPSKIGDSLHFHSYLIKNQNFTYKIELDRRLSTDSEGMTICLGLQTEAKVELNEFIKNIESKLSEKTLLTII